MQCHLRAEFALLRHQSDSFMSLCMTVSTSYSSHKLHGAIAQRIRFGILDFSFIYFKRCLISFMPQALSGMGWLHTNNVNAKHACDHDYFSSIPIMKKYEKE